MASNTQKHKDFVDSQMGGKAVDEVPGVGPVLAKNLKDADITTAKMLYGHYLTSPSEFKGLIKSHGGNAGQQRQADDAMRGWDQQHN
jgi:hypothetical protein